MERHDGNVQKEMAFNKEEKENWDSHKFLLNKWT